MDDENKTITIPVALYEELMDSHILLGKLQAGGVDSWEWYEESLKDD